jgi:hypothetical protein
MPKVDIENVIFMNWLRAGWPKDRSLSPSGDSSRPVMAPIQPPIQWVPVTLLSGVKLPKREADHSSPSSAEGNTSTPPPPTHRYGVALS